MLAMATPRDIDYISPCAANGSAALTENGISIRRRMIMSTVASAARANVSVPNPLPAKPRPGDGRRVRPPFPNQYSGRGTRRSPPAHCRDALAQQGDGRGSVARRTTRDNAGTHTYWVTNYDWRKCEAKLNALPQFITKIDGLDIHFIHVRSKHENASPLIVTHGWPGSIVEQLKIVDT